MEYISSRVYSNQFPRKKDKKPHASTKLYDLWFNGCIVQQAVPYAVAKSEAGADKRYRILRHE